MYKMPSWLFICSQLRHLNLHNCLIHPPLAFEGFYRLVCLELCRVMISSEVLRSLISHCPLLEQLVLKISNTLDIIEITAPRLRSFDFTGSISFICLKDIPHLAKVSLICESSREAENFDCAKFFKSCSALEHLHLDFRSLQMKYQQGFTLILTVSNIFTCLILCWWNHISSHLLSA